MTPGERLRAVANRLEVDRQPLISWTDRPDADAIVVTPSEVAKQKALGLERRVLAEIVSPFGRALAGDIGLSDLLREQPEAGAVQLAALEAETRKEILQAVDAGADGFVYRLVGAHPPHSTPMQYGGYYLELDREILSEIMQLNSAGEPPAPALLHERDDAVDLSMPSLLLVLYVPGGPETYLDFVSDLPAHIFAWDEEVSGVGYEDVRAMRDAPLASERPDADAVIVTR